MLTPRRQYATSPTRPTIAPPSAACAKAPKRASAPATSTDDSSATTPSRASISSSRGDDARGSKDREEDVRVPIDVAASTVAISPSISGDRASAAFFALFSAGSTSAGRFASGTASARSDKSSSLNASRSSSRVALAASTAFVSDSSTSSHSVAGGTSGGVTAPDPDAGSKYA